jgi:hypothetical protein
MGISFYPRTFLPPVAALFDSIIRHYEAGKKIPDLYKLFPYIPNLSILFSWFSNTFITFLLCFYGAFGVDKYKVWGYNPCGIGRFEGLGIGGLAARHYEALHKRPQSPTLLHFPPFQPNQKNISK